MKKGGGGEELIFFLFVLINLPHEVGAMLSPPLFPTGKVENYMGPELHLCFFSHKCGIWAKNVVPCPPKQNKNKIRIKNVPYALSALTLKV